MSRWRAANSATLVLALLGGCASTQWSERPFCNLFEDLVALRCTISTESVVEQGRPVIVRFVMRNGSRQYLHIRKKNTPLSGTRAAAFIVRRDGVPIGNTSAEVIVDRIDPDVPPRYYVTIAPGETLSVDIDLASAGYEIDRPGRYEVEFAGVLQDIYGGAGEPDRLPRTRRSIDERPGVVYCNRAVVEIVGRP